MLDDKLVEYISGIKSPFDEENVSQEEISFDGYMQYFRDCMLKSIGTKESSNQFLSYWDEFIKNCDEKQKDQFIKNCLNEIIKHYKMSFLSSMIDENEYTEKDLISVIKFFVHKQWLNFFPKSLSFIDEKILNSSIRIKIFINSDYDSFVNKLNECKRCNKIIREYFMYCGRSDAIETLLLILQDDLLSNYIEQYKLKKGKLELKND